MRHVRKALKRIPVFKVFNVDKQLDTDVLALTHLHRLNNFKAVRGKEVLLLPGFKLDEDTLERHARDHNDVGAGVIHAYRIAKNNRITYSTGFTYYSKVRNLRIPINKHIKYSSKLVLKGYIPKGAHYIIGMYGDIAATSMVMQTKTIYKLVTP